MAGLYEVRNMPIRGPKYQEHHSLDSTAEVVYFAARTISKYVLVFPFKSLRHQIQVFDSLSQIICFGI
ncbi:hypothetical protein ACOME3_005863 [Neoechinorhynchus agilis]